MEPKLYWWVLYANNASSTNAEYWNEIVVDIHPFTAAKILRKQVISWNPISEKEYNLWKQLNSDKNGNTSFKN
jgi:hypothetical protein